MLPFRYCPIKIELEFVDNMAEPISSIPDYANATTTALDLKWDQALKAAQEFTAANCSSEWWITKLKSTSAP